MLSLISLQQISKTYQSGEARFHALKNVTLSVVAGEMLAIMGASGSGKSTLMNIMGFLDHCTSGKYYFADQDVSHLAEAELALIRNEKVGFVFQSFFLLPRLSALQNVMLPLFYRGTAIAVAEQRAVELLEKVGMAAFAKHKPNQLSGGQQQRVAIARALIGDPAIILADEPTGALDSQTGRDVMALLTTLNTVEKRTIVIITHDAAISRQCQRTVFLKDGCLVAANPFEATAL